MIRDARVWAVRPNAFRTLPSGLPAAVVVRLDSRDLDVLAAAAWSRGPRVTPSKTLGQQR